MVALIAFGHPAKALAPVVPPPPPTIEEKILIVFYDAPVMLEIAKAESQLNCQAKNPNSSAKGCLQILDGTWAAYRCRGDVMNEDDTLACGRRIYDAEGTTPWNASKSVWGS